MRPTILWPTALSLLGFSACARATSLPADSLVCESPSPVMFVIGQESLVTKPASEVMSWAQSNLPKMKALQRDPNPKYDAMFKSINGQLIERLQALVDTCVASTRAVDVDVVDISPNRDITKVSMPPERGQRATRFLLERALVRPRQRIALAVETRWWGFYDAGVLSRRHWVTEFIGHVLRRGLSDDSD